MCESISVRAWVEELVCEWLRVSSCAWACVVVCVFGRRKVKMRVWSFTPMSVCACESACVCVDACV